MMVNSAPAGWHTVTPRLVVHDPVALVGFLKDTFDASGDYAEGSPAQMQIGDSIIMISGVGPRDHSPAFLYVYVSDTDATYRRALAAGAISTEEPWNTPYGDRRAMVKDPSGNDWQIA